MRTFIAGRHLPEGRSIFTYANCYTLEDGTPLPAVTSTPKCNTAFISVSQRPCYRGLGVVNLVDWWNASGPHHKNASVGWAENHEA